ncbi:2223_t:CDS:1, partial [Racocetra persica]
MSFLYSFLETIPTISSTVLNHFTEGPPKKSWDLKFHLAVSMVKSDITFGKKSIEQYQKDFDNFFM